MRKTLAVIAFACFAAFSAEAAVHLADDARARSASVQEDVSVIILVRDISGKKLFRDVRENIASTAIELLAATGAQVQSLDLLHAAQDDETDRQEELAALSPAEAMDLTGADYALVLQLSAPIETPRGGTIYARQNVSYTLFAATGKAIDSGRVSKIFDATTVDNALREIRAGQVVELAVAELEKKIADGKLILRKTPPAQVAETEIVAVVETMSFPQVVENKDGTFSVAETQATVTFPGVTLKISGLDYTLSPDGAPTKIKLPVGRALFVSATHRDIEPLRQTIKLGKSGEKIVLPITLTKAARERWKKDLEEISDIVSEQKITAARAARIRAIAKYWENAGMRIYDSSAKKAPDAVTDEVNSIKEAVHATDSE